MAKKRAEIKHQYNLNCLNKRHRILLMSNGKLVLVNHQTADDIEATQVQEALSGQKCKCLEILRHFAMNGMPRTGRGYREFDWHKRNTIRKRRCEIMTRELRLAAIDSDKVADKRWMQKNGTSRRHEGLREIGNLYTWHDLSNPALAYYKKQYEREMYRIDLPTDRDKKINYLVAKVAATTLGEALKPIRNDLTVYCEKDLAGEHHQLCVIDRGQSYRAVRVTRPTVDKSSVFIDRSWLSRVYLRLNRQPVVDGYFIIDAQDGDPSWLRALGVTQRRPDDPTYVDLVARDGWLFMKPFGSWGFMPDKQLDDNLTPVELPVPSTKAPIEDIIAFTDHTVLIGTNAAASSSPSR